MTQQEAYQQLLKMIKESNKKQQAMIDFAIKHRLVLEIMERGGEQATLNPEWLDGRDFKDELPEDALEFLHKDYCGCSFGYKKCGTKDEIIETYAGQDINDCWVPSQFC